MAEESSKYNILSDKKGQKVHDRLVKNILKDKEEIRKFINQFITKSNYINEKDLVKYTNSFITKKYKAKEADLVYKIKNKNIFFLIEHQSKIDNSMPYRMLNYCIDIMNEWRKSQKIETIKKYPVIIPIVIYTGDKKWKVSINFKEKQISTTVFENYKIDFKYNLIDINKITDKELTEKHTMFGYFMMIEKAKNKKELLEKLKLIIENEPRKEKIKELEGIILYCLNDSIENTEREKLLEKINKKVGDEKMSTLIERLTEENKRIWNDGILEGMTQGIKQGIKQGISQGMTQGITTGIEKGILMNKEDVAKEMLEKNFSDETIIEIVKITKEKLQELKETLNK